MTHRFKLSNLYLFLVFAVLYAPILFLIVFSFSQGDSMSHFHGFTFSHYLALLNDTRLIIIVLQTLLIALLSSLIATIIGTLGALGINQTSRPITRNSILSLNNILIVSPDVIIGASFLIFFTALKIPLGFTTVLLSHIAFSIPIVVLMVLPKLRELGTSMVSAASDLGASNGQILSKIILPYITPGILSGFFMALTYSLDDFAVTFFVTGNGFSTLSVEIYSRARQGISLEINALSGILFLFALVLVVGYYFLNQYQQNRRLKRANREEDIL
ncbi:ABC transporter permease [Secundilactobacillus malefermentans]|uniref:ABC transmembrane type-1 domain-containing protein n=1 Tax=Secundilactobacillus malefermentans TaxID=176292 RepID=A0A4V3A354_9LACO|nr:ABC transporter permease [Secundilactobacillus malefermentans]QEA31170.1 ABC transporter permease [Secundilactobacillus malefermentans]TDG72936.1 hypothetical protein C5L31_000261 [Secundilactobacillus malefermentans]